jgi:hypothetical protein
MRHSARKVNHLIPDGNNPLIRDHALALGKDKIVRVTAYRRTQEKAHQAWAQPEEICILPRRKPVDDHED